MRTKKKKKTVFATSKHIGTEIYAIGTFTIGISELRWNLICVLECVIFYSEPFWTKVQIVFFPFVSFLYWWWYICTPFCQTISFVIERYSGNETANDSSSDIVYNILICTTTVTKNDHEKIYILYRKEEEEAWMYIPIFAAIIMDCGMKQGKKYTRWTNKIKKNKPTHAEQEKWNYFITLSVTVSNESCCGQ